MKTTLSTIILSCLFFITYSQEIPKMDLISGQLIEEQWVELGTVKNITVYLFQKTNLETKDKNKLIALGYHSPSSSIYSSGRNYYQYIELDEVESLVQMTNFFETTYFNKTVVNQTNLNYKTKNGLEITFYANKGTQDWKLRLAFDPDVSDSYSYISFDSFKTISENIVKANLLAKQ